MVRKLAGTLATVGLLGSPLALGLGLGNADLQSSLNQPLKATIQLSQTQGVSASDIRVMLADEDAFARAGLQRQFFLQNLDFVVRDGARGPYIELTSQAAVKEPFLNLLLTVEWPQGRLLREYTFLLDPPAYDSTTVGQQYAVQTSVPATIDSQPLAAPAAGQLVEEGARRIKVGPTDTLWSLARQNRPNNNITIKQAMLAIQDANPDAFPSGNINDMEAGSTILIPNAQAMTKRDSLAAIREVARQNREWVTLKSALTPKTAPAPVPAKPATPNVEQDKLKLVAEPETENTQDNSKADELAKELALSKESLDKSEREKADLSSRLDDLQKQIGTLQKLIRLKDEQLSAMENMLAKQNQLLSSKAPDTDTKSEAVPEPKVDLTLPPVASTSSAAVTGAVSAPAIGLDLAAEAQKQQEMQKEGVTDSSSANVVEEKKEIKPFTIDESDQKAAESPSSPEEPGSFIENNMMAIGGGIAAVLAAVLGVLVMRRRKGGNDKNQEKGRSNDDSSMGDLAMGAGAGVAGLAAADALSDDLPDDLSLDDDLGDDLSLDDDLSGDLGSDLSDDLSLDDDLGGDLGSDLSDDLSLDDDLGDDLSLDDDLGGDLGSDLSDDLSLDDDPSDDLSLGDDLSLDDDIGRDLGGDSSDEMELDDLDLGDLGDGSGGDMELDDLDLGDFDLDEELDLGDLGDMSEEGVKKQPAELTNEILSAPEADIDALTQDNEIDTGAELDDLKDLSDEMATSEIDMSAELDDLSDLSLDDFEPTEKLSPVDNGAESNIEVDLDLEDAFDPRIEADIAVDIDAELSQVEEEFDSDSELLNELVSSDIGEDNADLEIGLDDIVPEDAIAEEASVADPIQDAQQYMESGQYEQAAGVLQGALGEDEANNELRLKFMEVLVELEDEATFDHELRQLQSSGDVSALESALSLQQSLYDKVQPVTDVSDIDIADLDMGGEGARGLSDELNVADEIKPEDRFDPMDLVELDSSPGNSDEAVLTDDFESIEESSENLSADSISGFDDEDSIDLSKELDALERDFGRYSEEHSEQLASVADTEGSESDEDELADFDIELVDLDFGDDIEEQDSSPQMNLESQDLGQPEPLDQDDFEFGELTDESAEADDLDYQFTGIQDALRSDTEEFLEDLDDLTMGASELVDLDNSSDLELESLEDLMSMDLADDGLDVLSDLDDLDNLSPSLEGLSADLDELSPAIEGGAQYQGGSDELDDLGDISEITMTEDDLLGDEDDELLNIDGILDENEDPSIKLDLARAYIDMGNSASAMEALQEVLQRGNPEQMEDAQKLMEKLKG